MIYGRCSAAGLLAAMLLNLAPGPAARAQERVISTDNMCGAMALACAASAAGARVDVERLVAELPLDGQLKSFDDLQRAARKMGLACKALRWKRQQAPDVSTPCIVRLGGDAAGGTAHFVTITAAATGALCIVDPPAKPVWVAEEEVLRAWDGVALYIAEDQRTLDSRAPSSSTLPIWGWMLLGGAGVALMWRFARAGSPDPPRRGTRTSSGRLAGGAMALAWLLIAVGLVPLVGRAKSSSRLATITVDSLSKSAEVGAEALAASGDRVRETFIVTNRGDRPALIAEVTPNCTCVSVEVSPRRIPPGGTARIDVGVDLKDKPAQEARLFVLLEDAVPQQLTLRFAARKSPQGKR